MSKKRKLIEVEIYLPAYYNDGRPILPIHLERTYDEVVERFKAYSIKEEIQGVWIYKGQKYEDINRVLSIVIEDNKENRIWLGEFKERLKDRFEQVDIFIKVFPVDLI